MAQRTYSARGELVDFEIIKIKQQLASTPAPTTVDARRSYIDEKAGVLKPAKDVVPAQVSSALALAAVGIEAQAASVDDSESE